MKLLSRRISLRAKLFFGQKKVFSRLSQLNIPEIRPCVIHELIYVGQSFCRVYLMTLDVVFVRVVLYPDAFKHGDFMWNKL